MHGTVRSWDDESGWGILVSPEVPGEVWAHFSAVRTADPDAFASLDPGETVLFTWEEAEQDGYSYRALRVQQPGDPETGWDDAEDEDDEEADVDALSDVRIEFDSDS
ncbi:cold-shock protein [Streptomyces microflavus]|uniref:cold-shock protein n=1 Tax=Streptomyces microflavus TaxID=1919 RepID=UPI003789B1FE